MGSLVLVVEFKSETMNLCIVSGCGRIKLSRGLCTGHYQRLMKTGSIRADEPLSKSLSKMGAKNHKWKGGQTVDGHGRIMLYLPSHPSANEWGYVYRYRIVMEQHLGPCSSGATEPILEALRHSGGSQHRLRRSHHPVRIPSIWTGVGQRPRPHLHHEIDDRSLSASGAVWKQVAKTGGGIQVLHRPGF